MIYKLYGQLEAYAAELEYLLKVYAHFDDEDLKVIRVKHMPPAKPTAKE